MASQSEAVSAKMENSIRAFPHEWGTRNTLDNEREGALHPADGQLSGTRLGCIISAVALATFLSTLDLAVVAVLLPKITDEFNSLGDVELYGASYLSVFAASCLVWRKSYATFPVKIIGLCALAFFGLGLFLCYSATSSMAFVFARACVGLGASGINTGALLAITHCRSKEGGLQMISVPLEVAMKVARVCGPLFGGVVADSYMWRRYFYVSFQLCVVSTAIIISFVNISTQPYRVWASGIQARDQFKDRLFQASTIGFFMLQFIPHYANLIGFVFTFMRYFLLALALKDFHPSLAHCGSFTAAVFYSACLYAILTITVYYSQLWLQGVQQLSAVKSAALTLPMEVSLVVSEHLSGTIMRYYGYHASVMGVSIVITCIGISLLETISPSTPALSMMCYQALVGLGLGIGRLVPSFVARVIPELNAHMGLLAMEQWTVLEIFWATNFIMMARATWNTYLRSSLADFQPQLQANSVLNHGGTSVLLELPPEKREEFKLLYSRTITSNFYIAVVLIAMSIVVGVGGLKIAYPKDKALKAEEIRAEIARDELLSMDAEHEAESMVIGKVDAKYDFI